MNESTILKLAIIIGATISICVGSCCAVRWKAFAEGYEESNTPSTVTNGTGDIWKKSSQPK